MRHEIVMPFFGRKDHFQEAVMSVLHQDDPDWKLTVIDDAYSDVTAGEWLQDLGDKRITYVRNLKNVGINRNFQRSIDLAQEDWVTIFGCDDILLPGYVTEIKSLAHEHPHAGLLHPHVQVIDAEGDIVRPLSDRMKEHYRPKISGIRELAGEDFAVSVTRGNWMYFPSIAWHRETIAQIGFRNNLHVVQDLGLAVDACLLGRTLVVSDQIVFRYRRHDASVSSWRAVDGSRFIEEDQFFSDLAKTFTARGWKKAARVARRHFSSRMNAVTQLPRALTHNDLKSSKVLALHSLGLRSQTGRDLDL